jgi:TAG lipase / steryl ester hydrolase / phospholipase A2 / LPA acyltransferase
MKIKERILKVNNYKSWMQLARILDQLEGLLSWKLTSETNLYDWKKIEMRYKYMKHLRKSNNHNKLMDCLRQDLVKNIGNICTPELYNKCYIGTKHLIEQYHNEIIKCI